MKGLKFILLWIVTTIVMAISWAIGTAVGNIVTNSAPPMAPQGAEAAAAGMAFLGVCIFNSLLIIALLSATSSYTGRVKQVSLILFLFVIQTLLPQMETYFFASQIRIGLGQVTSIVIAGAIVSLVTMLVATLLHRKLFGTPANGQPLVVSYPTGKNSMVALALLIVVGYPFVYLIFGRFIAWQSETVRMYYTGSIEMAPFSQQLSEIFGNGLYFFQLIRASIWIAATVPVITMLKEKPVIQFLLVGILTSLLSASLLFIPNPYMPHEVAMVHFVETSTSNFLWGLMMVWAIRLN